MKLGLPESNLIRDLKAAVVEAEIFIKRANITIENFKKERENIVASLSYRDTREASMKLSKKLIKFRKHKIGGL